MLGDSFLRTEFPFVQYKMLLAISYDNNVMRLKCLLEIERAIGVIAFHNVAYPKELRMCRKTKNNNCRPASLHKMVA